MKTLAAFGALTLGMLTATSSQAVPGTTLPPTPSSVARVFILKGDDVSPQLCPSGLLLESALAQVVSIGTSVPLKMIPEPNAVPNGEWSPAIGVRLDHPLPGRIHMQIVCGH